MISSKNSILVPKILRLYCESFNRQKSIILGLGMPKFMPKISIVSIFHFAGNFGGIEPRLVYLCVDIGRRP
jgi:hypothetical protein